MPTYAAAPSAVHPATHSAVEPVYAGPHRWQIGNAAKAARRVMRWYAYTRWVDRYCDPLTVRGVEQLQSLDGPAIFVANHQSHMDTLVLFEAMPERVKRNLYFGAAADRWFVKGKKKLVLQPWYQSMVLGNFPIVRGGGAKSLEYARWLLQAGLQRLHLPGRNPHDEGRTRPLQARCRTAGARTRCTDRAHLSVGIARDAAEGRVACEGRSGGCGRICAGRVRSRHLGRRGNRDAARNSRASSRRRACSDCCEREGGFVRPRGLTASGQPR